MQFLLTEAEYKEMSDRPSRECFNKAADERQALEALAEVGLAPRLRLVPIHSRRDSGVA